MQAAVDLVLRQGFYKTRVVDIAKAAGVGKSTFYEYFSSKDELCIELFSIHVLSRYQQLPAELEKAGESAAERLRRFFEMEMQLAREFSVASNLIVEIMPGINEEGCPFQKEVERFLLLRYELLYDILKYGVDRGEFKIYSLSQSTLTIAGAFSFYCGVTCHFLEGESFPKRGSHFDISEWSDEALLQQMLRGICA
jgi:AcrR family transcriptional regulator